MGAQPRYRDLCSTCWQPSFACFCHKIEKFNPEIEFVILIHPIESRRRIATGRMSFLSLEGSHIVRGVEFANCPRVNGLLENKSFQNYLLSPGPDSTDLTSLDENETVRLFGSDKRLRIFVVDGTWSNAGKMVNKSPNLAQLPRIHFTPTKPSNIRVRKQPNPRCYSTLEAIHYTIGLLGPYRGFDTESRVHDKMLLPFKWMVDRQIKELHKRNVRC